MRAVDFVRIVPELVAWLESREVALESALPSEPTYGDLRCHNARIAEVRHLMNHLKCKIAICREETEICLGW